MAQITMAEAVRVFARIGLLSFGGPAAQIAVMHRELVQERPWLTEEQFLRALSFCMLLPGPEAMQLATYAGWRLHGVLGGLIAGLLFVLPGAAVMLALAAAWAAWGAVPLVEAVFLGIKASVVVIVIAALIRLSKKALGRRGHLAVAALSFMAIYAFNVPFPAIIVAAALWGAVTGGGTAEPASAVPRPDTLRTVAVWLAIWGAPVALAWGLGADMLTEVALFFSKLAVVTFGGAYAVLAYMAQEVVAEHGWLTAAGMLDGLGLAETTPGPLILVTEFVGFQAGFGAGGWGMAVLAALMTLHVTFAPCFLWIFAGAPYLEWIASRPRLTGAMSAISAAVVGVILNLSIWFSLHVLFGTLSEVSLGPARLLLPQVSSLQWGAAALTLVSAALILWRHWSLPSVLAVAALGGLALHIAGLG